MTWQKIRTMVLDKLFDTVIAIAMVCAASLLGTLAIATPILVLKWLTHQVCN